jgi:hypothetical protein
MTKIAELNAAGTPILFKVFSDFGEAMNTRVWRP